VTGVDREREVIAVCNSHGGTILLTKRRVFDSLNVVNWLWARRFSVRQANDVSRFRIALLKRILLSAVQVSECVVAQSVNGLVGDFDDLHRLATFSTANDVWWFRRCWRCVGAGEPVHPAQKHVHQPFDFVPPNTTLATPHPTVVTHFLKTARQHVLHEPANELSAADCS